MGLENVVGRDNVVGLENVMGRDNVVRRAVPNGSDGRGQE